MNLADVTSFMREADLGELGSDRLPPRDEVRALQGLLCAALTHDEFTLDCVELELRHLKEDGPPGQRDLFVLPDRGIHLRLIYWLPKAAAGPHEHTSWTVTGVFHNRLEVRTYRIEDALERRALVPKNTFFAERGAVGHIYAPCIHEPRNPTDHGAVSIHVFNENDRPKLENEVGPVPGLGIRDPREGLDETALGQWRDTAYRMQVAILARFGSRRAVRLVEEIYDAGDVTTRLVAASSLAQLEGDAGSPRIGAMIDELGTARLVRNSSDDLAVRVHGDKVELVRKGAEPRILLTMNRWAEAALRFLVEREDLAIAEVPGLGLVDKVSLCAALVRKGALAVAA